MTCITAKRLGFVPLSEHSLKVFRSSGISCRNGYESIINNYLIPEFGQKPLPTIGPGDLTSFFERARMGKRKNYLLNLYSLLRVMFEVALENDRIERSPMRKKLHRSWRRRHNPEEDGVIRGGNSASASGYLTSTERCLPVLR